MLTDVLRILTTTLALLLLGQIIATVYYYLRVRRAHRNLPLKAGGIIPSHVVSLGALFVIFVGEAVWQTIISEEQATVLAAVNTVLLAASNQVVFYITRYERRRFLR